jgi:cobalt-zinc-cadmium efflux system protein
MADTHAHPHAHDHSHHTMDSFRVAFFLNLGFTLFEIVGGVYTNSLAILSDAVHDLGDSLSLGMSWYLEKHSQKGSNARYSYGYRRFSLLAALINTVVLVTGSLFILSEAIPRLFNPQHSNAGGMALLAVVGITVNGLAVLRMHQGQTLNAQVVTWHLLEDVLGWIAVLIVSISLMFMDIHILDPLLSILISLYVLYNVVRNLRKTIALFLQAVPEAVDLPGVEDSLLAIPQVESVHHTHIWSLDGEHHVLTTHLVVEPEATKEDLIRIKHAAAGVAAGLSLEHATIELEFEQDCSMNSVAIQD